MLVKRISEEMLKKLEEADNELNLYRTIFDIIYNLIVVVDHNGLIRMMNQRYCDFLKINKKDAIGVHVTKVIENTRMHIVIKTGKEEVGDVQEIMGNKMIADRFPIVHDGKVIGAVGTVIFKDLAELDMYVKRVSKMEKEIEFFKKELKKALGADDTFETVIGDSEEILKAVSLAKRVSDTKSSVLILGESGTGKGLFANAIHNASPRSDYPLIKVNCAAIPAELLESELFGYESGAFTGAQKGGKPGKFELAHKSTIFLDEIGDMPLNMQAKLLKVIQEKEIERIGGVKGKDIDIRIIAATNQNLEEMVKNKTFREDLYYRLNVIKLVVPSLRSRKEDVPLLVDYIIKKLSKEMDRFVTEITPAAMECLQEYDWPGNIRELENVIERAFNLMDKEAKIELKHLPPSLLQKNRDRSLNDNLSLRHIIEEVEKNAIEKHLKETMGNKYQTSQRLGISRTSLYEKINRYQIKV